MRVGKQLTDLGSEYLGTVWNLILVYFNLCVNI